MYFSAPSSRQVTSGFFGLSAPGVRSVLADLLRVGAVQLGELLLQLRGDAARRPVPVGRGRRRRRRSGSATATGCCRPCAAPRGTTRVVGARASATGEAGCRRGWPTARLRRGAPWPRARRRGRRGVATPAPASQHRAEPQLGGLLHGVEDVLVLLAGDRDDDVVAGRGHLGLRDAEAVDPVADDRRPPGSSESLVTVPAPLARRGVRMTLVPPSRSSPSRGWYFCAGRQLVLADRVGRHQQDQAVDAATISTAEHREGAARARRARVLPREDLFSVWSACVGRAGRAAGGGGATRRVVRRRLAASGVVRARRRSSVARRRRRRVVGVVVGRVARRCTRPTAALATRRVTPGAPPATTESSTDLVTRAVDARTSS